MNGRKQFNSKRLFSLMGIYLKENTRLATVASQFHPNTKFPLQLGLDMLFTIQFGFFIIHALEELRLLDFLSM